MNITVHSLSEIEDVASEFVKKLQGRSTATIVGLYGNLGAGKTTFSQTVAKVLGVEETVTSPTFIIEKVYSITSGVFNKFIHIDAYRLDKPEELARLGWKEISENPKNLIFIEWPEKLQGLLPEGIPSIRFEHVDETTRSLTIDYGQN